MSLALRISAFFLAALALVLVGFSAVIYTATSWHLDRELDDRLNAALDTLEASIDVEPGGLEWEPQDRRILLGTEIDVDDVRWIIATPDGTFVDRSANFVGSRFPDGWRPASWPVDPPDGTAFGETAGWRVASRRLLLEDLLRLGRGHPEDDGPENDIEYPALVLVAGLSQAPVEANLRQLALALGGTSLVLWLACAALGYGLSRRALTPVVRMAAAARQMSAAEPAVRLPAPGTGDELDELAQAFNELLARLHAAVEHQRRFAGDASHQLRTPIAGLLSMLEVLKRRQRSTEEYAAAVEQVHHEAVRMRQIVESLMFLAKSEVDSLPVELETLDLTPWLPEQLKRWDTHPRGADLHLRVAGWALAVKAHPALLAQLVDNLIDNACKYSEPGTPIIVRAWRHQQRVLIAVEDEGRGVADQDLPHLFEPFYRAADVRRQNQRGVGLGLAVVRRIADTLGATIAVERRDERGTRFVVSFPGASPIAEPPAETSRILGVPTQA